MRGAIIILLLAMLSIPALGEDEDISAERKELSAHKTIAGDALYKAAKYELAKKNYIDAIYINPENAQAHSSLGLTYQKLRNNTEAIRAHHSAIESALLNNDEKIIASSYYNIGQIYEGKKDFAYALHMYQLAQFYSKHQSYDDSIARMMTITGQTSIKEPNSNDKKPERYDDLFAITEYTGGAPAESLAACTSLGEHDECMYVAGDLDVREDSLVVMHSTGEPVSGLFCHCEGNLKDIIPLKDGKIHGTVEEISLGSESTIEYKDGKRDGISHTYSYGGNGYTETYKNGKREGIATRGGNKFTIPSVCSFEYAQLSFFIESQYRYKNDKIEGTVKHYAIGRDLLVGEESYKNGKREGIARYYNYFTYDEKTYAGFGDLLYEISYKNDKPVSASCANGEVLSDYELEEFVGSSFLENGY